MIVIKALAIWLAVSLAFGVIWATIGYISHIGDELENDWYNNE